MAKTIYDLQLHEKLRFPENPEQQTGSGLPNMTIVTRVPGGWIYELAHTNSSYFVEWNDEFKDSPKPTR